MSSKGKKIGTWIKHALLINLGIVMIVSGIYFFKSQNGFAIGGVSGLAIILAKLPFSQITENFAITQSMYMMAINLVLLIVGVIILGKKCGLLTIYCSLAISGLNMLFEWLFPLDGPLTEYPLLELIYAVLLVGIGCALLFKCNASSGGTDIVALILKKYTHMNVGVALLISDILITASTFFVYYDQGGVKIGLFSMLGLFAKTFVVDDLLESLNMCKAFTIVTTKPKEISDFILNEMHHSATAHEAKGVYTGEDRKIIITVCRRSEALRLKRRIKQIDPGAFMIVTKSSEILGKGFMDT